MTIIKLPFMFLVCVSFLLRAPGTPVAAADAFRTDIPVEGFRLRREAACAHEEQSGTRIRHPAACVISEPANPA